MPDLDEGIKAMFIVSRKSPLRNKESSLATVLTYIGSLEKHASTHVLAKLKKMIYTYNSLQFQVK